MDQEGVQREVFWLSWLTQLPYWCLGGSVTAAVTLVAHNFGLEGSAEALVLAALPLAWVGYRAIQWAAETWTVTAGGCLVIRRGILQTERREIELASVRQPRAEAAALLGWLGVGHLVFQVMDREGTLYLVKGRWLAGYARLQALLQGQGELPVGRPARRPVRAAWRWLARRPAMAYLKNHDRFMAFCHHVLRAEQGGLWPPPQVPAGVAREWMDVLRRARVVVDATNERGWQLGRSIQSLEDIRRRIGPGELARAVA